MVNLQGLPHIANLLTSPKKNIRKEAVWSISNVCAGTHEQMEFLLALEVFPKIVNMCIHDDPEIKREAVWAISNAVSGGNPQQVFKIVNSGAIQALCSLLSQKDSRLLSVALEGLNNLLKCGQQNFLDANGNNPFTEIVEQCDGLTKLEELQRHPNTTIYEKALKIMEVYFELEEDDNADLLNAIMSASSGQFNI